MERSQIIQKLMEEQKLKVSDIQKISNIPYSTIKSILERGTEKANYLNVRLICEAIGITPDELEELYIANKNNDVFINTLKDDSDSDDMEIFDLAAHGVGHGEKLTPEELERVKMAIKIALAKDK